MHIAIITILTFVATVKSWITQIPCDKELSIGQIIMKSKVVGSSQRTLRVFRGTREVFSGDVFNPMELLTVHISDIQDEYVYDVRGGALFKKGSCGGTRIFSTEPVTILLPAYSATIGDIRIVAGWGSTDNELKVTRSFILIRKDDKDHPRAVGWYDAENLKKDGLDKEEFWDKMPTIQTDIKKITSDRDYSKLVDNSIIKANKNSVIHTNGNDNNKDNNDNNNNNNNNKNDNSNKYNMKMKNGDKNNNILTERVEMTPSERRKEMEKIRDRELFGVHGHDSLNKQMYEKKNSGPKLSRNEFEASEKKRKEPKNTLSVLVTNISIIIFIYFLVVFGLILLAFKLYYEQNKLLRFFAKIKSFDE